MWSRNPLRWLRYALLRLLADEDTARAASGVVRDPLNISPRHMGVLPGIDPLSSSAGESRVCFISRHSLVESGAYWETVAIQELVAKPGEFWRIRRGTLPSTGEEVEFLHHNSRDCYLVASPDTEHGDHLLLDKTREEEGLWAYRALLQKMNCFVRRDPTEIARERLGGDLTADGEGSWIARPMAAKATDIEIDEQQTIPFVQQVDRDEERTILSTER